MKKAVKMFRELFIAAGFAAAGILTMLAAVGVVTGSRHAPPWVATLCGCLLLLAAVLPLTTSRYTRVERFGSAAGLAMICIFAVLATWIAFGPGSRAGAVGISLPFLFRAWSVGDLPTRVAFGAGAVFLDSLAVAMVFNAIRGRFGRKR